MKDRPTNASTRKNRPDHGSCLRNTRARLVFPVTTGVKLEDIKRFPLPQFTPIQKENIISLVDKVITQKRNSQIIDTSTLEKQIDDMVYQLYDLTDEEIAIIEGSINGK